MYEELATAPSTTSPTALIGQAVSEIHLGRLPEAEAALNQVLTEDTTHKDPQALANAIVLANLMGKGETEKSELLKRLREREQQHALLTDLEEKEKLFDEAKEKYAAKVGA